MKNQLVIIGFLFFFIGCASSQSSLRERLSAYEIFPSLQTTGMDSGTGKIIELKFKPMYHAQDAQKLMYQKYGEWGKSIKIERKYPLLIWEDVKIFEWSDELFTIGTSGENKHGVYYCSVVVFNSNQENCFDKNNAISDSLVSFFIRGTQNLEPYKSLELP